jgi:hypothetical protein
LIGRNSLLIAAAVAGILYWNFLPGYFVECFRPGVDFQKAALKRGGLPLVPNATEYTKNMEAVDGFRGDADVEDSKAANLVWDWSRRKQVLSVDDVKVSPWI